MKSKIKLLISRIFDYVVSQNALIQENNKLIKENYWANVFNSSIQNSDFLIYKSLNPGRWGASYSFLYVIYRILDEFHPENVIEFGLGQTSKLTIQYSNKYQSNLNIIEHDENWATAFKKNVPNNFNAEKYIKLYELEEYNNGYGKGYKYKNFSSRVFNAKFNLVIIDGPFGSEHNSRTEILKIIEEDMLADDFVIIIDDCERIGEMETVDKIKESFDSKGIDYVFGSYSGEKKQVLFTNKKNKFLLSM